MDLENHIELILARIRAATEKSKRSLSEVQLVAVSKKIPADKILMAIKHGLTHFGENRIEEAELKIPQLPKVHWHFIGHLQSRKVKRVLSLFELIHSVDSIKLLDKIEKETKAGAKTRVLLQLNIAEEPQKYGFSEEAFFDLIMQINRYQNIEFEGLMTMAPLSLDPEDSRSIFKKLRQIRDKAREILKQPELLKELSMGMSQDYEVAIEEGATMVRIGSALFKGEW